MNTNKEATKAVCGPGGLRCSCCRIFPSIKASRRSKAALRTVDIAV